MDKVHTTNYQNVFIEVAEDCPVTKGEIPPTKNNEQTVASIQFEMLNNSPYEFTSDDVLFQVFAIRNNVSETELLQAREQFFSKGQPCFRASPLTKRYGWGIHSNDEGKIAMFACETEDYQKFTKDKSLKVVKAMKSTKK